MVMRMSTWDMRLIEMKSHITHLNLTFYSSEVPVTLFSNPALRPNSLFQRLSSSESSSTSEFANPESDVSPEDQEKVKGM